MTTLTTHPTVIRPSPLRDRIYIVNSNYNHYGQSVLRPHSRSGPSSLHSSLSRSGSTHSSTSYNGNHKRPKLDLVAPKHQNRHHLSYNSNDPTDNHDDDDDDFALGEVEDQVVELNTDSVMNSARASKPKYFNYRSLINPDSKVKRFLTKLDSDGFSLFSSSSRVQIPLANINSLPTEVLKLVISYCNDHKTQVSCLYVNHSFYYAAKPLLYESPLLTSSYRVAQLISSLKEFKNGEFIKVLDLSNLSSGVITRDANEDDISSDNEGGRIGPEVLEYALASWRDWKYRDDPLYGSMMLNSYTLSKSKSNISTCDSTMSVGSSLSKMLSKWKFMPSEVLEITNMKESMKKRLYKWKKRLKLSAKAKIKVTTVLSRKPSLRESSVGASLSAIKRGGKSVNFSTIRDPRDQPFVTAHPYTNKFLLKYAGLKDVPIGYMLYFIDLCPNIKSINLSQLTLSSDFAIVNENDLESLTPKIPSLIDTVLGIEPDDVEVDCAHYLSDANVYFKVKSYHESQFIKLYELDVLKYLNKLENLEMANLSNLTWLNYRNIRGFVQSSKSVNNGTLKMIDFTNSGMIRDLKWAKKFEVEELKEYFETEVEKVVVVENDADVLARTIGMDY